MFYFKFQKLNFPFSLQIIIPFQRNLQMKFLALSSLIGLGLLAQQSQATLGFDQYLDDEINQQFSVTPAQGFVGGLNQGFQTLLNGLNFFNSASSSNSYSSSQSYVPSYSSSSSQSSNLQTQPNSYKEPESPKRSPHNPLEVNDPKKWSTFDNEKRFCNNPRVWDGQRCKCPKGCYFSGRCYPEPPKQTKKDLLSLRLINRNFDGTQNNPQHPEWGSKASQLLRLCEPNYEDGKSVMWQHLPKPRYVSNIAGQLQGSVKESRLGLNMLFNIWGQFLDHDITLSPTTTDEPMNIQIPRCDKYMDKKCTGKEQLPITRSIYNKNKQVRTNINVLTPWVDASQVYGSDKETADSLRQFKNGKLKTSEGNLLPRDQTGGFVAGDFRVNENVALTVFQTIFMRQHNRICDVVLQRNPNLCDQEVFQIARNYVIGLVQHITYDEYLPALLGKQQFEKFVGQYEYDPSANPNIYTEFSTAAFRLGHPMVNSPFKLMDNWGNLIDQLEAGEMFFNPKLVTNESVNQFLNGLARTGAKERSLELVKDLRNFLFFPPSGEVKLDLFAFNIQRGRDHGVGSVKDAREKMGLPKKEFKELFENQDKAVCLEKLYQDTDNLDLWLGIIGEKAQNGSTLGELGIRLNAFQFKKIRNGDRFWYENTYPESIIKQIKATSFADVIKRNSGVKILKEQTFKKV